jgi:hypothetical protein
MPSDLTALPSTPKMIGINNPSSEFDDVLLIPLALAIKLATPSVLWTKIEFRSVAPVAKSLFVHSPPENAVSKLLRMPLTSDSCFNRERMVCTLRYRRFYSLNRQEWKK